mgnify:CR=1 FL=1
MLTVPVVDVGSITDQMPGIPDPQEPQMGSPVTVARLVGMDIVMGMVSMAPAHLLALAVALTGTDGRGRVMPLVMVLAVPPEAGAIGLGIGCGRVQRGVVGTVSLSFSRQLNF